MAMKQKLIVARHVETSFPKIAYPAVGAIWTVHCGSAGRSQHVTRGGESRKCGCQKEEAASQSEVPLEQRDQCLKHTKDLLVDTCMPAYRTKKASRYSKSSSDKSTQSVHDDLKCIRGAVASRPEPSAVRHRSPARVTLSLGRRSLFQSPKRDIGNQNIGWLPADHEDMGARNRQTPPIPHYEQMYAPEMDQDSHIAPIRRDMVYEGALARSMQLSPYSNSELRDENPFWVQRKAQEVSQTTWRRALPLHPTADSAYHSSPLRPSFQEMQSCYEEPFHFAHTPQRLHMDFASPTHLPNTLYSLSSPTYTATFNDRPYSRPFSADSTQSSWLHPPQALYITQPSIQILADPPQARPIHYISSEMERQEAETMSLSPASRSYFSQEENFHFAPPPMRMFGQRQ